MKAQIFACALFATAAQALEQIESNRWNWSKNIQFSTSKVVRPENPRELAKLIKAHDQAQAWIHIRVYGSAHSFNSIADSNGIHLSLEEMRDIKYDPET